MPVLNNLNNKNKNFDIVLKFDQCNKSFNI